MKFFASLPVILCASPILAHTTTLPHAHDVSPVPLLIGLGIITTALMFGKFYKRVIDDPRRTFLGRRGYCFKL
jgi:hypothetical protein